jgi:hypothetical protein
MVGTDFLDPESYVRGFPLRELDVLVPAHGHLHREIRACHASSWDANAFPAENVRGSLWRLKAALSV